MSPHNKDGILYQESQPSLFTIYRFPFDNFVSSEWKIERTYIEKETDTEYFVTVFTDGINELKADEEDIVMEGTNGEFQILPPIMFETLFEPVNLDDKIDEELQEILNENS